MSIVLSKYTKNLFFATLLAVSPITNVFSSVDIRVSGNLGAFNNKTEYVAYISDCTQLISIDLISGTTITTIGVNDALRVPTNPVSCEFPFSINNQSQLLPKIVLNNRDLTTITHNETFQIESNKPKLSLVSVSLKKITTAQNLVIAVNAVDDIDIQYLNFSVTALRASDLRNAGGVIGNARKTAFAQTNGVQRIYPEADAQGIYYLSLPITGELSLSEIAHNGIVLLDVMAVDSSGNQTSISTIEFTGADVVETASDLSVSPTQIIFTNLLESALIVPSVNFQFRGVTSLSTGPNNWSSSDNYY